MSSSHPPDSDADQEREPVRYFRFRFFGPALGLTVLISTLLSVVILSDDKNRQPNAIEWMILRISPFPFSALFVGLHVWLCPIRVTPRGIKYPSWPLIVRELPWEEMHRVRYINLGFRYVVVYRRGQEMGLWLMLSINRLDLFHEAVRTYAGDDHPLVAVLDDHCA